MSREYADELTTMILLSPDRNEAIKCALTGRPVVAGERTKKTPDEDLKRHLRELHREAAVLRNEARELPQGSLERKLKFSKARQISAQISRLRLEQGWLLAENEEDRRIYELQMKYQKQMEYWDLCDSIRYQKYSIRRLNNQIDDLRRKIWESSFWDDTSHLREQLQELEDQLAAERMLYRELRKEASLLRMLIKAVAQAVRAAVEVAQGKEGNDTLGGNGDR